MRYAITIGLIFAAISVATAEHRESLRWMSKYKGWGGAGCCSELDCREAQVALLSERPNVNGELEVYVNGQRFYVPQAWVHPSETHHAYWCFRAGPGPWVFEQGTTRLQPPNVPTRDNTRCVFFAVGW